MGDETDGGTRNHARDVREERLQRKLHRELGSVVLEALADDKTVEVMVNPDGRVWWDRLGDGQSLLPDRFTAERAESLVGTVAALLNTVANQEEPIVEGELPFFGFRFEGVVPPVSRQAPLAIRKHAGLRFTCDDSNPRDQLTAGNSTTNQDSQSSRRSCNRPKADSAVTTMRSNAIACAAISRSKSFIRLPRRSRRALRSPKTRLTSSFHGRRRSSWPTMFHWS
ncbi:MAG: Flp pilus assembly complex ATPase component [bacterium]|nr:Flp pilus assembly complex ATPase component [bacterium]